jgi:hypothetical protein
MGKVTGLLEIDRRDRRYLLVSDRIRLYKDFMIPLSEEATKDQAARGMEGPSGALDELPRARGNEGGAKSLSRRRGFDRRRRLAACRRV